MTVCRGRLCTSVGLPPCLYVSGGVASVAALCAVAGCPAALSAAALCRNGRAVDGLAVSLAAVPFVAV